MAERSSGDVRVRVRDGLTLRVHERGAGPPVLLLHGFTGSVEAWGKRVLDGLAGTWRVLAVDLPGHGLSDAPRTPERCRLEEVVEDLCHVLGELGAPRARWIGYSMGGRVALGAAVLRPERVERLVLEGASPGLADEAERRERRGADEALARRLESDGIGAFVDHWASLPLFATRSRLPPSVRAAERERRLLNRPEALAACLRGLGTGVQPSLWERLPEVAAPTLLLTGDDDDKFTRLAERMAAGLPEAVHVGVPGAGHTVHLEAPEAWLEAVTGFLGGA
ncbi:MAG TPA: 2-succinyl-6-hydroxy-2,4-cyclohexadiene-1-carboxylate synthase [Candidatus Thermoplasmatota archaeon]